MSRPSFIHLRLCSDFSISHGLAKIGAIVERAVAIGMPAIALTDATNLCGWVKFYGAAHKAGIKPIVGAELQLYDPELGEQLFQFTVLAANNRGYKNLIQLISKAHSRGVILGAPAVDRQWLAEHREGLILLSGGAQGDVGTMLLRGQHRLVKRCIAFYRSNFADSYYLEINRIGRSEEEEYLRAAVKLAVNSTLPLVATNPVCFLDPDDFAIHEIRVAICSGHTISDPKRTKIYSPQQYLCSAEEMERRFADLPEALLNSVEIAKRCNVTMKLGEYFLPQFPTGGSSADLFLVEHARAGLLLRLHSIFPSHKERSRQQPRYEERLEEELALINRLGFPGYFLIVMEFIKWAKENDIPVGPGRGSGVGSLVAYALQITDLDPLAFDLLFERFLNPERVSMPDFDIDFCMDKRELVVEHVAERYGREAVSQIITFGTMAAKAAIRDVGRVLGHPYGFVDKIAKLIPPDLGMTIEKAMAVEPQLLSLYQGDEEVRALVDRARKLEGVIRNAGKHAAGVVIAPTKITDFSPILCDVKGQHPVTQFDKNDIEYIGLLKFDFLGLRTLTIIRTALDSINAQQLSLGNPPIDISAIPLDDPQSFALLKRADTTAVFQLESRGFKELIKRLKPDCFEDLIALVSLYRPGTLQSGMVENFINRKHGLEAVSYPDPQYQHHLLKPILEPTYGVILYQEQVMQIARALAGYTLGEADILRRAMGKKNAVEMAEQREIFESGAKKLGIDGKLAIKIFDLVEKFAGYGFNKSHAAAYALVSYQTLWLKSHFPAHFMAASMTADMDNLDKVVILVEATLQMRLTILSPDINKGHYTFTVNLSGEILYGIGAIKGVGRGAVDAILEARGAGGPFTTIFDLCTRVDPTRLNRRVLEKLIMAGAMDGLGDHRAALMASVDAALKVAGQHATATARGQIDMFGALASPQWRAGVGAKLPVEEWSEQQRLAYERETLGLYLSGHPIREYLAEISHYVMRRIRDLTPTGQGRNVTIAGWVVALRLVTSKRGKRMALLTLDDCDARLEVVLFEEAMEKWRELLIKDQLLFVSGSLSLDNFSGGLRMVGQELKDITSLRKQHLRGITLLLNGESIGQQFWQCLHQILQPDCAGDGLKIQVQYQQDSACANLILGEAWRVAPTDRLFTALRRLVGVDQVVLNFNCFKL